MTNHPEVHLVAGCVVGERDAEGRESVERVVAGQVATFWAHYRVTPDGRQEWLADFEDRDAAIRAAQSHAGRRRVYVEESGALTRLRSRQGPAAEDEDDIAAASEALAEYARDGGVSAEEALRRVAPT